MAERDRRTPFAELVAQVEAGREFRHAGVLLNAPTLGTLQRIFDDPHTCYVHDDLAALSEAGLFDFPRWRLTEAGRKLVQDGAPASSTWRPIPRSAVRDAAWPPFPRDAVEYRELGRWLDAVRRYKDRHDRNMVEALLILDRRAIVQAAMVLRARLTAQEANSGELARVVDGLFDLVRWIPDSPGALPPLPIEPREALLVAWLERWEAEENLRVPEFQEFRREWLTRERANLRRWLLWMGAAKFDPEVDRSKLERAYARVAELYLLATCDEIAEGEAGVEAQAREQERPQTSDDLRAMLAKAAEAPMPGTLEALEYALADGAELKINGVLIGNLHARGLIDVATGESPLLMGDNCWRGLVSARLIDGDPPTHMAGRRPSLTKRGERLLEDTEDLLRELIRSGVATFHPAKEGGTDG